MSWATKELEKVDLGDTRRNRRLVKIVEDLAGNPESSIPQASRDAAAIQAAYDFFNNPRVKRVVTIGDREADIYQLFAQPRRIGSEYLIRAYQKRSVKTATSQTEVEKLQQAIIKSKPIGQLTISLKRTTKRQPRPAKLTIRSATYLLQPPESHPQQSQLKPLKIQVILAQEETPPPTEKPIKWLLVTTLPVTGYQQACLCLKWYSYRWLIERYHYTLKSGCNIENIQLETAKRIERALATYAIVAWRLLWLTYLARNNPETPATQVFQTHEWQALYCVTHQTSKPPSEPPTLQECVLWIAKLGGFLGRKTDGEPGVKTIWLGMRSLHDIAQSWLIAHTENS